MTKALLLLAALLVTSLYAGVAGADSMPACSAGTRLVANPVPSGAMHHGGGRCEPDPAAKKYERPARQLYAKVAEGHAKTPWEVIAKREKLTALGMEWQAY